jgi:hypothetical protein
MVAELTWMQVAVWRQLDEPDDEIRRSILRDVRQAFAEPGPRLVRGDVRDTGVLEGSDSLGVLCVDENNRALNYHRDADHSYSALSDAW